MKPLTVAAAEPAALDILPSRPRLLIVDDQPINIQVLYQAFQADHEVFVATSGAQALDFCRGDPPDLILLDVMMPEMDGLEVCRRLKPDPGTADIPVIFVSAQQDPADETRALEAGGVDFITKPINRAVVRARVRTHLTLKAQADLLRSLAFIDGLTGVANRRRFDEHLQTEWRYCRRGAAPLTLIMIDIDHFKRYNDHYGHQAGDTCLVAVAAAIKKCLGRSHDLVARYGGEEFVCLLPDCGPAGAVRKAETLRQAVVALVIPHAASATAATITVTLGIASCIPDADTAADQLLAAADAALYAAKTAGRNRVCETAIGKLSD
ncbi:MAG: diguanylate cyclase [Gammaproteobacteria bacterium]|nr:diguanylate cyclase [Rhodocyclaceae bacterium]MBU3907638.1 diguanylate cyclase [Gammaproteobacteria bacterium]MBU3990874.1 diguanylate cyclase [Gammaproteobacteria bacterium]MBU4004284.1 diguanylate cyclase [Gammaproteobacteria bacterium]MBU4019693.1 diguanylate cyclase [Gammaproteobacteria bacterium]